MHSNGVEVGGVVKTLYLSRVSHTIKIHKVGSWAARVNFSGFARTPWVGSKVEVNQPCRASYWEMDGLGRKKRRNEKSDKLEESIAQSACCHPH